MYIRWNTASEWGLLLIQACSSTAATVPPNSIQCQSRCNDSKDTGYEENQDQITRAIRKIIRCWFINKHTVMIFVTAAWITLENYLP